MATREGLRASVVSERETHKEERRLSVHTNNIQNRSRFSNSESELDDDGLDPEGFDGLLDLLADIEAANDLRPAAPVPEEPADYSALDDDAPAEVEEPEDYHALDEDEETLLTNNRGEGRDGRGYGYQLSQLLSQVEIARGPKRNYRQLLALVIEAISSGTLPEGYDDRHRTFESLVLATNREDGWETLEAKYLLKLLGKGYAQVIADLVAWGRLEMDSFYIVGAHCRRYRLLVKGARTRVQVTDGAQLARIYRWRGDLLDRNQELLTDPTNRWLHDSGAAVTLDKADLPDLSSTTDPEERREQGRQISMALKAHRNPFLRKDASGRFYHGWTAVPGWLRPSLRAAGEALVGFDVRASHWLSFIEEYSRSEDPRAEDLAALVKVYQSNDWTAVGGKLARNAFLCGGKREKTRAWFQKNARHALRWFSEQRLVWGRAVYKLWIGGERRRARAMYEAMHVAAVSFCLDHHDGFFSKQSEAARCMEIAQRALAAVTGGIGVLVQEVETLLTNNCGEGRNGRDYGYQLQAQPLGCKTPKTIPSNIPPETPTLEESPTNVRKSIPINISLVPATQETAERLVALALDSGIAGAAEAVHLAVAAGYAPRRIASTITWASRLPATRRTQALRKAL